MGSEFSDDYGGENTEVDVTIRERRASGGVSIELAVVCTKMQSADDFVSLSTDDRREVENFFRMVKLAEDKYRELLLKHM